MLSKNKMQWLDLASCLWPSLLELHLAKKIQIHYDHMVKYSKPCFNLSSKIIIGLSSISIMIMAMFTITNPL
jgi:hypothetical protein